MKELCRLDELPNPGSRGFELDRPGGEALTFFLVRRGEQVFGYRNRCPHTGAPLEWQPHRFLDAEGCFIQCALHGAIFRMEDGQCLRGPCAGDALEPIPVKLKQGRVLLCLEDHGEG